jgi:hypothetical protein
MAKTDLAYAAGLLDGEGTIFICRQKATAKGAISVSHYIQVSIVNTHKPTIEWTQKLLGIGKIIQTNQGKKPLYRIAFYSKEAIKVLKILLPYLKIKREQALLAIEFDKVRCHMNSVKSRQEELKKRDYYKLAIAKLNKFGGVYG